MDKGNSTRVTRTRAKSGSTPIAEQTQNTSVVAVEGEMAPNVNGNKDGSGESTTAVEATPTENIAAKPEEVAKEPETPPSDVSVRVTRKRKAADVKAEEDEVKLNATKDVSAVSEPKPDLPADTPNTTIEEHPHNDSTISEDVSMDTSDTKLNNSNDNNATESTNNSINNDLKDIAIGIQTFGKGKRARVPNKRYSDIARFATRNKPDGSPRSSAKASSNKNGEFPDDDLGEILREESEAAEQQQQQFNKDPLLTPLVRKSFSSLSSSTKKGKPTLDLANPAYLKPFKYGWKRELVYRSTYSDGKRNGDIYYYTPSGKKVRSMREVSENLKNRELSLDDFTFFKEPLGLDDPDKEIIRDAKKAGLGSNSQGSFSKKISTPKLMMKKKRSKTPSMGGSGSSPTSGPPAKSPKLVKSSSFKVKVPTKKFKKVKRDVPDLAQSETTALSSNLNLSKKAKIGGNLKDVESKPCRPCSIRCEGVLGLVPTLQCHLCLCLYHNECVGIPSQAVIQSYVCKNCQPEPNSGGGGASGTNALLNNTIAQQTCAEQEPIVKDTAVVTETAPPQSSLLNNNTTVAKENNKSLVGSLTTWFPSSSTLQVDNVESEQNLEQQQPRRPQLVEYIGDKKYLIVPRHNILNVKSPVESTTPVRDKRDNAAAHISPPQFTTPTGSELIGRSSESQREETEQTTPESGEKSTELTRLPSTSSTKQTLRSSDRVAASKSSSSHQMQNHLQNLAYGYKSLFFVFQYLKVQDLLRAGCVCSMWWDMACHPLLWRTVRMKNSQIHSFDGLANALKRHGTVHLDLRKMLLPANQTDDIWPSFTNAIKKVKSLRRIELCRCLASVVEDLARNNHNLEVINAVTIKCETMTLQPLEKLTNLVDLRLKSTSGLTLTSDLSALKELKKLKHLSITSIKDLNKLNIEVIGELVNLEVLDLGECTDFPKCFGPEILSRLVNLEKLRLEKGHGECHTFEILDAVKDLSRLQQLELVNFDIKTGFDKALGACYNINKLLIIPTYVSQSATTNHMVLGGVLRLQKTLSHFVWGVTLELLRVTELFVDQCEQPDKKVASREKGVNSGDSIPVLKPVPLHGIQQPDVPPTSDTPQVEILPLPNLQKLLLQNLPTTRVKILKIPFHATWRQSITDSVN